MNPRRTILTAALSTAAAVAVCAALAGCSTHADAAPITSVTPTGTAATSSGSSSATPSTSTSTSLDPAAQETKDRQDAEIVWHKYTDLLVNMQSLPADQVEPALAAVAVDPALGRMQAQNSQFRAQGKVGYGTPISFVAWPRPVGGSDTTTLEDCQDGSQAGYKDAKTGNKLTVGTPNTPIEVTLKRTAQGWRVSEADVVSGQTCTPGKAW